MARVRQHRAQLLLEVYWRCLLKLWRGRCHELAEVHDVLALRITTKRHVRFWPRLPFLLSHLLREQETVLLQRHFLLDRLVPLDRPLQTQRLPLNHSPTYVLAEPSWREVFKQALHELHIPNEPLLL